MFNSISENLIITKLMNRYKLLQVHNKIQIFQQLNVPKETFKSIDRYSSKKKLNFILLLMRIIKC